MIKLISVVNIYQIAEIKSAISVEIASLTNITAQIMSNQNSTGDKRPE